jgi:thymidylate synthase
MSLTLRGCTDRATFESMDDVQRWVLKALLEDSSRVAPRGEPTLERLAVAFTLRHPRRRCITNAARRWSLPLAVGEFCWHVSGSHDATFLSYYAARWADFAGSDSTIQGSCYGYRAFFGHPPRWERLSQLLRFDPNSRRAVLVFQDPDKMFDLDAVDVACASTLQFLIRDGELHAVCNMRSNDAIWGLPYDVFLFTMMQELLACQLGLELGEYHHCAGSMHIYQRHIELSRRICAQPADFDFEMPVMGACEQLPAFLEGESRIRIGPEDDTAFTYLDLYWRELLAVLLWFRRAKRDAALGSALPSPGASRYERLLSLVRI